MDQFIKIFMNFFSVDSLPLMIGVLVIIYIFYKQYILPKLNNLDLLNSVNERISNISTITSECELFLEEIKQNIKMMKEKLLEIEKNVSQFPEYSFMLENLLKELELIKNVKDNTENDEKITEKFDNILVGLQKIYDLLLSSAKIKTDVDKEILSKLEGFDNKLSKYNEKLFNDKKVDFFK